MSSFWLRSSSREAWSSNSSSVKLMDVCGIKRSMNGVPAADSSLARAFCCGGAWLDTIDGVLGGRGEAGEMAGAVMLPELLRLRLLGAETPAGKGNCFVGAKAAIGGLS